MTRQIDRRDPVIDPELSAELERYAKRGSALPPADLADHVMVALANEPAPRRGFLAWLAIPGGGQPLVRIVRAGLVTAGLVLVVAGTLYAGQLAGVIRNGVGTPPSASPSPTESVGPMPTSTQQAVESEDAEASASPLPSLTPAASAAGASQTATPQASVDDSGGASPSPSGSETPSPSPTESPSPTPTGSP